MGSPTWTIAVLIIKVNSRMCSYLKTHPIFTPCIGYISCHRTGRNCITKQLQINIKSRSKMAEYSIVLLAFCYSLQCSKIIILQKHFQFSYSWISKIHVNSLYVLHFSRSNLYYQVLFIYHLSLSYKFFIYLSFS